MDRRDEEFEAFLRQFQPSKPRALPEAVSKRHVRPIVWLAAAATVIVCVGVGVLLQDATPKVSEESKASADALLMEAVMTHLSRPLPAPMEPLIARFPIEEGGEVR